MRRVIIFQARFLTTCFLFILGFLVVGLVVGKLLLASIMNTIYSAGAFKLEHLVTRVFVGDSHGMCTFNDSIIPASFNASRNSESYFQTFYKLKKILKENPQVKTVLLSYSPHNIVSKEGILYGDRYFPLLDSDGRKLIKHAVSFGLLPNVAGIDQFFQSAKHRFIYNGLIFKWTWGIPSNVVEYIEYYSEQPQSRIYRHPLFTERYRSNHSYLDSATIKKAITRHFGSISYHRVSSDIIVDYLFKMIHLCINNEVKLILVGTPLHHLYREKIPKYVLTKYYDIIDSISTYNPMVNFIDLSELNFPDNYFGDGDHLNYSGNREVAPLIRTKLDSAVLFNKSPAVKNSRLGI